MLTSARLTTVCLAAVGSVLLTACSSNSSGHAKTSAPNSAPIQAGADASTPSVASAGSVPAAAGGLTEKGCTAMKTSDVQSLLKDTAKVDYQPGSAELDPTHSFQCDINDPEIIVSVHPEDAAQQNYKADVAAENVPAFPLSGVGDAAVWTGVSLTSGFFTAPPDVYAHKGSVTCEITGSGSGLTIPVQPGVAASYAQTDEAAFAAKLGVLCTDIFGAIG